MNQETKVLSEDILYYMIKGRYFDYSTLAEIAKLSPKLYDAIENHYDINIAIQLRTKIIEEQLSETTLVQEDHCDACDAALWLTTSPAARSGEQRLTDEQQKKFIELVSKNEQDRTVEDLYNAGVIRPDYTLESMFARLSEDLHYIRSNAFLAEWLNCGYMSERTIRKICSSVSSEEDPILIKHMKLINMSYAVVYDERCDVSDCYLPFAELGGSFYKANFEDAVLGGATAYDAQFEDCGRRDDDSAFIAELIGRGVRGLYSEE